MRKLVFSLCLLLFASMSAAAPGPIPGTNGGAPSADPLSPLAPAPSCPAETPVTPGLAAQPAAVGYDYYGYCYSDCSFCWSRNHGSDCPGFSGCMEIPLC